MRFSAFGYSPPTGTSFGSDWIQRALEDRPTVAQADTLVSVLQDTRSLAPQVHQRFMGFCFDRLGVEDRHRRSKGAYALLIGLLKDHAAASRAEREFFAYLVDHSSVVG